LARRDDGSRIILLGADVVIYSSLIALLVGTGAAIYTHISRNIVELFLSFLVVDYGSAN